MTSKIKVDNINKVSDDSTIIKKCGSTTTVGSGSGNTIVVCGSTVTMGRCGGTVALASGASQTGFGRTGTVDWQTGAIKTGDFTAVNTQGFFVDTNGGAVTATLPAGSAGAIISFQDYRNTFDTHSLTILPNGSEKINTGEGSVELSTEGEGITLVYIDSTVGWRSIQDNVFADTGSSFLTASGGTESTCGNCKIHTFTGPGTFAVSKISTTASENIVSYMVVAGGGAGGATYGGGGGAGGFREVKTPVTPYTASPLDGYPSAPNRVTVTATSFPITVGGGGAGAPGSPMAAGNNGNPSVFSTITATAGGGGGACNHLNSNPQYNGKPGGSGGGAGRDSTTNFGSGNTPPVTPAQGTNGGQPAGTSWNGGGGGGGATAAGGNGSGGTPGSEVAGNGGTGATTNISGSPTAYAGGGGGSNSGSTGGGTATQGGGTGGNPGRTATAGQTNTGAGGGGSHTSGASGTGGSGIVIIRYKFQ
jgi:hypothetical protein